MRRTTRRSDTYGEGRLEFPFSQFRSWDGGRNCRNGVPEASDLCPQELVFGSQGMGDPFRTGDDYAIMQQCVVCGSLVSRVDDGDEEYGAHGDEDHDEDYDGEDKGDKIFLVPRGRNLRATAKGAEQRFRSGVGKGLARNKKLRDGRCNGPRACQCADGPPAETKVSARRFFPNSRVASIVGAPGAPSGAGGRFPHDEARRCLLEHQRTSTALRTAEPAEVDAAQGGKDLLYLEWVQLAILGCHGYAKPRRSSFC
ncbi:hypothetical protein AK812_SmicGene26392 [Symbiodinium microadriaticum]|uniref:Uncharacterized protein n=1 Tax=Symbiodinium microadriaticum TaxID=2951 RepID=A0A1Q9D9I6_SYMMI|nr:hypothetical protein AK812_SmicGene26392 [Symbiodinium microadriaticum]